MKVTGDAHPDNGPAEPFGQGLEDRRIVRCQAAAARGQDQIDAAFSKVHPARAGKSKILTG